MTDAARAARILHGIERILDERTTPIPPRVMQHALRVVRGALEGPMTAERRAVEAAIREPQLAQAEPPKASWRYDKATRLEARRLYEAGVGPTAIARQLGNGLTKQTINDWRKAGGWARPAAPAPTVAATDHSSDASKMVAPEPEPVTPEPQAPAAPEQTAPVSAMPVVPAQMVPAPQLPRLAATPPSAEQRHEEDERVARLVALRHMASWLRAERDRQGLTATTLATAIGVPSTVLGNLLSKSTATSECTRVCAAWLDRHAPGWRDAAPPASVAASSTPNAPRPPALSQLEPVPASITDAENWLYEELVRERGKRANHTEIEARIALFTPDGLLREVNTRRLKHGLPPYVISGRAA